MKEDLKECFDTRNVNAVNPSYLYRSGTSSPLDREWAQKLGREAVRLLSHGPGRPTFLTIKNDGKEFTLSPYPLSNLRCMEEFHRFVSKRFYNPDTYSATEEGRNYLSRMVEEVPEGKYGLT